MPRPRTPPPARVTTRSAALHDRALAVMPAGNTRTTIYARPYPRYAARGRGAHIVDVDGQELLDCLNNYTALIHGHAFPEVVAALQAQLELGTCFALPTESEVVLAELLQSRVPTFERIRFTNSGTEAVMQAIKAARAFTGRPRIAKCEGAYHGTYDYAEVSLDPGPGAWGPAEAPAAVSAAAGTPPSVAADVLVLPFNDVEASRALLHRQAADLAAVVIDPMPHHCGLVAASAEFLHMLRTVTREIGALFILDEVITFRLGPGGAQGRLGVTPDLTTLGKIIGGGLPVGALAGRADVMDVFAPGAAGRPRLAHGGTFNANPLSMVAGLAAMTALTDRAFAQLETHGAALRDGLAAVLAEAGGGAVTGAGSLCMIHPGLAAVDGYRAMRRDPEDPGRRERLHAALLECGVLIGRDGLLCVSTAMTGDDVERVVAAVGAAMLEERRRPGRPALAR